MFFYLFSLIGILWVLKLIIHIVSYFHGRYSADVNKLKDLGKWAVVTGSTDGIGKELAKQLYQIGLSVVIVGRSEDKLEATRKEISALVSNEIGNSIMCVEVDFSKPDDYSKLEKAIENLEIGVLINNVGVSYEYPKYYDELTPEFIDAMINVNVKSLLNVTHMVYAKMKKRQKGAILSIGSAASVLPSMPFYAAYSATKSAAVAFSNSLQLEAIENNITVQCHTPSVVCSKMSKVKKESYFTCGPSVFAKDSLLVLSMGANYGGAVYSPYLPHALQLYCATSLPAMYVNEFLLKLSKKVRVRALSKLE